MKILILFAFMMMPLMSMAKCKIPVSQLSVEHKKIEDGGWLDENGNEDNTALYRADVIDSTLTNEGFVSTVEYEAFVRPDNDGTFQVLPIPLFMVDMEKNRDTIYICAHVEPADPDKTEVLVYFLRYGHIKPVTPVPLPLTAIKNLFWGPLRKTPFVVIGIPVTIAQKIQAVLVHIFGDLTRFGVDRVRINNKEVQLYSGGDPAQFDHYIFKKTIPLQE